MTRVKRGKIATKKRHKILKYTKGFRWGRKSKERAAKEALLHAWTHAFRGRKEKKRDFRQLWNVKINAASRANGIKYSWFIAALKKHKNNTKNWGKKKKENPGLMAGVFTFSSKNRRR